MSTRILTFGILQRRGRTIYAGRGITYEQLHDLIKRHEKKPSQEEYDYFGIRVTRTEGFKGDVTFNYSHYSYSEEFNRYTVGEHSLKLDRQLLEFLEKLLSESRANLEGK